MVDYFIGKLGFGCFSEVLYLGLLVIIIGGWGMML